MSNANLIEINSTEVTKKVAKAAFEFMDSTFDYFYDFCYDYLDCYQLDDTLEDFVEEYPHALDGLVVYKKDGCKYRNSKKVFTRMLEVWSIADKQRFIGEISGTLQVCDAEGGSNKLYWVHTWASIDAGKYAKCSKSKFYNSLITLRDYVSSNSIVSRDADNADNADNADDADNVVDVDYVLYELNDWINRYKYWFKKYKQGYDYDYYCPIYCRSF